MIASFQRQELFPTLVYRARLGDSDAVNAQLIDAIAEERSVDVVGVERSNQSALGGWHSRDTLHKSAEFAVIARAVRDLSSEVARDLNYTKVPAIVGMWAITNAPGAANRSHVHPGSLWSGVYYVQVPDGAGNIEFTDPRTANLMRQPRYTKRPDVCRPSVTVTPEAGMLLLFPSWLYHEVHPNQSSETRTIISFNLA